MKKIIALLFTLLPIFLLLSCSGGSPEAPDAQAPRRERGDVVTLNVYNWGEYISDGFEGSLDTNAAFEEYFNTHLSEKYGGITVEVNYTTFANNEEMYSKLKNSAVVYDIVVPSDYMIEKMIAEDMLLAFDVAADIPNYVYIDEAFRSSPYYDPTAQYTVPYTYGMMGIIYNTAMVDEADIGSWDLMWNDKYAGKILQFNNPRDAFATAMYLLGLDVNSNDRDDWAAAYDKLLLQKPLVQGYVNDEVFNKMTSESAAIAPYYVGDFITMADQEENLAFYYPKEGVNYFVDAMCIPKSSKNPDIAKEYMNFMLSEEAAIANAEYIGYASPNTLVYENEEYREYMGEFAIDLLYGYSPDEVNASYNAIYGKDASCYHNFTPDIQSRVNTLWENLKIADSTELWVHVTAGLIVAAVLALAIGTTYIKKKRSKFYRERDKKAKKS
ncbi:MAG: ABC transporter substrate-binding protein [Clostridia bacterium]|nr:ABC transporter substrate-binding protein [Clostridia bacterium]